MKMETYSGVSATSTDTSTMEGRLWSQLFAGLTVTFGVVGFGAGLGWPSPVLPTLVDCVDNPAKPEGCAFPGVEFTPAEEGWTGSFLFIGAILAGPIAKVLFERIGLKGTMLVMTVPTTLGWTLLAVTKPLGLSQAPVFYLGRALTGFGTASVTLSAPIYISETAATSRRGPLSSMVSLMITVGLLYVNGLGSLLPWDVLTALLIIVPVLNAGMLAFIPESPYYLIRKGKDEEARKSISWLRGKDFNVDAEIQDIKESLAERGREDRDATVGMWTVVTHWIYLKPLLLMVVVMAGQQITGANAVTFYLVTFFLKAGFSIEDSLRLAPLVSVVSVLSVVASIFSVERLGRRTLLIFSGSAMSVANAALGTFFYLDENVAVTCGNSTASECSPKEGFSPELLDGIGWMPLASMICFVVAFFSGYAPQAFVVNGEIFSLEAKAVSSSFSIFTNFLLAFTMANIHTSLVPLIGVSGMFFVYFGLAVFCLVVVAFFLPETTGKSPQEMKQIFGGATYRDHEGYGMSGINAVAAT